MRALAAAIVLLAIGSVPVSGQSTPPKAIDPQTITSAKKIYVGEVGDGTAATPSVCLPLLKSVLESTSRFTVLPTTRGADVLLLMSEVFVGDNYMNQNGPTLMLNARDPRTYADLGTITAKFPLLSKTSNEQAVTSVLNTFFALDRSTPPPAFTVTNDPKVTVQREHYSFLSLISDPNEATIASAKKVFVWNDGMREITQPYNNSVSQFSADIQTAGHFQVVSSLQEADLILSLRGSSDCVDYRTPKTGPGYCNASVDELNLDIYSALTGELLATMQTKAKTGKTKANKPSPFQVSVAALEKHFESVVQKEIKNVAKMQAKKK